MKKIYYLGYYDVNENKEQNRKIFLAATNKMSYIIDTLDNMGYEVEVISTSNTLNPQKYDGKIIKIGTNSYLRLFKTLPMGNIIKKISSILYMRYQYKKYILNTLTKEDTLIVYHSVSYARFIEKAKKKIGFRLIMEVEEIYSDVNGKKCDLKKEEYAFRAANAYIFSTELLDEKINVTNKPSVISHGTYKVEPNIGKIFNDDKIHVVYAGTFDPRKGGVYEAIRTAEFLDQRYHVHILGFGSQSAKQRVIEEVQQISKKTECTITFDGLYTGKEYIKFIQSCNIGLSTQNPDASFNATSFPSKILSYMANGLKVVSIRIPVVEISAINQFMFYYDEQIPEKIAAAIKKIDVDEQQFDSREIISRLHKNFACDLKKMLGD